MKIVCLGDSFTEGFLVKKTYVDYLKDRGYEIVNLGVNGDTTSLIKQRFIGEKSDVLIIFAGTNDFYQNIPAEEAFENIKEILNKSKAKKNILVIPPLVEEEDTYPVYELINNSINYYGQMLKTLNLPVVDARDVKPSYIDGIHMREEFHQKLAEKIRELL